MQLIEFEINQLDRECKTQIRPYTFLTIKNNNDTVEETNQADNKEISESRIKGMYYGKEIVFEDETSQIVNHLDQNDSRDGVDQTSNNLEQVVSANKAIKVNSGKTQTYKTYLMI